MPIKEEFEDLIEKLKIERDEVNLKLHLATMEVKEELEEVEKKWGHFKNKAAEVADDTKETSEEFIAKVRIVGEELNEAYHRINERLSK